MLEAKEFRPNKKTKDTLEKFLNGMGMLNIKAKVFIPGRSGMIRNTNLHTMIESVMKMDRDLSMRRKAQIGCDQNEEDVAEENKIQTNEEITNPRNNNFF